MNPLLDDKAEDFDYVNYQNKVIDENITYRTEWESDCKLVMESYRGNKYPSIKLRRGSSSTTSRILKEKGKEVYVNMVKRQYRVMANYLLNNEPQYILTKIKADTEGGLVSDVREFFDYIFEGRQNNSDDSFYDSTMDDVIFYGLFRGINYTLVYHDEDEGYSFKNYDSLDTYIDLDARKVKDIRKFVVTYTKPKEILKSEYKTNGLGEPIDWDEIPSDNEQTRSKVKKCLLVENPAADNYLVREGYYLIREGKKDVLYRVLTTGKIFLSKEKLTIDFMPIVSFTPNNEPGELYPRGWYVDMLTCDRKINDIMSKLSRIIETGGRFVYVRLGTVLHEGTSQFLNKIGIEVIEVSEAQELPKQATLLTISQSDIEFLNILMQQCEDEGGMKSDIMGNSSLGADASGRAIQALQAGSKNNIGTALNELNKYMTRIVYMVMRLYKVYGGAKFYSEKENRDIDIPKDFIDKINIKVDVAARSAFDEITKEVQAIQMLDIIQKFNPELTIPPELITQILGASNDYAEDIQLELDKQEDPDLQIAEGENKKMMNGVSLNVNEAENHQLHIAMHSELLQSFPPDSPAGEAIINHLRQHEAFMQTSGPPQA